MSLLRLAAAASCLSRVHATCDDGWLSYGAHCYYYDTNYDTTWSDARAACQAMGADLACIESVDENSFLEGLVAAIGGQQTDTWFGYSDEAGDLEYEWFDGRNSTYEAWEDGQPASGGSQGCAEMEVTGEWRDRSCDSDLNYFCERDPFGPTARPAPAPSPQPTITAGPTKAPTRAPSPQPTISSPCDDGWLYYGVRCYYHDTNYDTTWSDARAACQAMGADLACVETADENAFLEGLVAAVGGEQADSWIGYADADGDGAFEWAGAACGSTYEAWEEGQPGGAQTGCAEMEATGEWRDRGCESGLNYLCEFDPGGPTPSPTLSAGAADDDDDDDGSNGSMTAVVAASVTLSGLACDDYGSAEEAILIAALASTLDGVEEHDIGPTTCDDAASRRRLLSGTVSIGFEIAVASTSTSDTPASVANAIASLLAAAVSAGTLAANIDAAAGSTASAIAAATVTGASAVAATAAPTPPPTRTASGASADEAQALRERVLLLSLLVALFAAVCCGLAVAVYCLVRRKRTDGSVGVPMAIVDVRSLPPDGPMASAVVIQAASADAQGGLELGATPTAKAVGSEKWGL